LALPDESRPIAEPYAVIAVQSQQFSFCRANGFSLRPARMNGVN
jgi:hypothetical protein